MTGEEVGKGMEEVEREMRTLCTHILHTHDLFRTLLSAHPPTHTTAHPHTHAHANTHTFARTHSDSHTHTLSSYHSSPALGAYFTHMTHTPEVTPMRESFGQKESRHLLLDHPISAHLQALCLRESVGVCSCVCGGGGGTCGNLL